MPGRRWKEEDQGRSREDTSAAGDRMQREERAQVSGRVLRAEELAGAARIWDLAWIRGRSGGCAQEKGELKLDEGLRTRTGRAFY